MSGDVTGHAGPPMNFFGSSGHYVIRCANCDHLLHLAPGEKWEHWTRHYKPHGAPYSTLKCHAPKYIPIKGKGVCDCKSPVPLEEDLLKYVHLEDLERYMPEADEAEAMVAMAEGEEEARAQYEEEERAREEEEGEQEYLEGAGPHGGF